MNHSFNLQYQLNMFLIKQTLIIDQEHLSCAAWGPAQCPKK